MLPRNQQPLAGHVPAENFADVRVLEAGLESATLLFAEELLRFLIFVHGNAGTRPERWAGCWRI